MTERPGLGRLHVPDTRDVRYPMRAVIDRKLAAGAHPRTKRTWTPRARPVLDQGQTPTCVGHAFAHYYADGPVTHLREMPYTPIGLYDRAQLVDGIAGAHEGTTGRAAASVLRTVGIISEYHNALSFQDVIDCLLYVGPVCVGTAWTADMFTPDADHYLHTTGAVEGGGARVRPRRDRPHRRLGGAQELLGLQLRTSRVRPVPHPGVRGALAARRRRDHRDRNPLLRRQNVPLRQGHPRRRWSCDHCGARHPPR